MGAEILACAAAVFLGSGLMQVHYHRRVAGGMRVPGSPATAAHYFLGVLSLVVRRRINDIPEILGFRSVWLLPQRQQSACAAVEFHSSRLSTLLLHSPYIDALWNRYLVLVVGWRPE